MKKVAYIIVALLAIYIILALLGKSRIVVERSITINKPARLVKDRVADLQYFHNTWSPWKEKDPAAAVNFSGTPGEPGHSMSWNSNVEEVGQGTLTIIAMNGDSIIERLSFEGMGDTKAYHIISGSGETTTVTWGMDMHIGFFGRPIMMFMNMDEMIGPDYEKGLAMLKSALESENGNANVDFEIKETEWPEVTYAGIQENLSVDQIQAFFGKNLPAIMEKLSSGKVELLSNPSGIYTNYDQEKNTTTLAAVFKVPNGTRVKGLQSFVFPASKVLHIAYLGPYGKLEAAHMSINAYMNQKGLQERAAIEEYVSDPGVEKDSSKWLTNIFYILK